MKGRGKKRDRRERKSSRKRGKEQKIEDGRFKTSRMTYGEESK